MIIIGTVKKLEPKVEGENAQGNPWCKQQLILVQRGETRDIHYAITAFGERKVALVANLQPGQMVEATVGVESREFGTNWYTDLNLQSLKVYEKAAPSENAGQAA